MSVPKSRRGESPAKYIDLAREIYAFTYNRSTDSPEDLPFYFSSRCSTQRAAYRLIKTANLIFIDSKQDPAIVQRNKQRRRELYEDAQGYYNSMLDTLDLAYMTVNREKLPSSVIEAWIGMITDEISQISKIKRSDKAR